MSVIVSTLRRSNSNMGNPQRFVAPHLSRIGRLAIAGTAFWATGAWDAVPFWVHVFLRMALGLFNAAIFSGLIFMFGGLVVGVAGSSLGRLARALRLPLPSWDMDKVLQPLVFAAYGVVWLVFWLGLDYPLPRNAKVPFGGPELGSLMVLVIVAAANLGVSMASRRSRARNPQRGSIRLSAVIPPEPDDEFWSPTPVIGWRVWAWNGHSLNGVMEAWPNEFHTAICDSCPEVPGWSHTCGIYSVVEQRDIWAFAPSGGRPVIGRVELSGLVVQHDKGYRAEHARIVELFTPFDEVARALALRYPRARIHVFEDERSA